mmetsp:Transcript_37577/g.69076  ORF Transcript_37577/g.69076 Transcript_37577/m.69076 type:complete len:99 (+) Transcript_37577:32-328(+)
MLVGSVEYEHAASRSSSTPSLYHPSLPSFYEDRQVRTAIIVNAACSNSSTRISCLFTIQACVLIEPPSGMARVWFTQHPDAAFFQHRMTPLALDGGWW